MTFFIFLSLSLSRERRSKCLFVCKALFLGAYHCFCFVKMFTPYTYDLGFLRNILPENLKNSYLSKALSGFNFQQPQYIHENIFEKLLFAKTKVRIGFKKSSQAQRLCQTDGYVMKTARKKKHRIRIGFSEYNLRHLSAYD